MDKEYKQTDDVTKEFLSELVEFLSQHHGKAQTSGDLKLMHSLSLALYETLEFTNEDDEEIDIMKI
jgi:hypothetical protein